MIFEKPSSFKLDEIPKLAKIASENHENFPNAKELDKPIIQNLYANQDSNLVHDAEKDVPKRLDETDIPSWHREEGNTRPTPKESEKTAQEIYGGKEQRSYKDGVEVPYGTPGSTRPDIVVMDAESSTITAIEVKNYDCTKSGRVNSLCRELSVQVGNRSKHMPEGTKQMIVLDIRGQNLSEKEIDAIKQKIKDSCADSYEDIPVKALV